MTDTKITIYVPTKENSMTMLDSIMNLKIDRILVPNIGKNRPEGGVSVREFLMIGTYAVWNGILRHAPDPISRSFLQGLNTYLNTTMGRKIVDNLLPEALREVIEQ
mmetsp:Transcript_24227/g.44923  ORF Transcript_24227/g.44923 Transcript_24227/m.44923 type:complete len:106 (+) Transcript_24227:1-318(+)